MGSWSERAERLAVDAKATPPADTFGLSEDVADGVRRLTHHRPRRLRHPDLWREIVADAEGLARDGWAAKAIALGWSAHDVFGTGPDGDASFDSLAVWLDGRQIAALTADTARTACGSVFYREAYLRPSSPRAMPVFLWEFGR